MSSTTEEVTIQDSDMSVPESPSAIESSWTSFVPMILIFAVFYFLLIRPQEKKRKMQEELVSSVKKGEDIMTTGGIYGKVVKVSENESFVMLEVSENSIIKIEKSAILTITSRKNSVKENEKFAKNSSQKTIEKKSKTDKSK